MPWAGIGEYEERPNWPPLKSKGVQLAECGSIDAFSHREPAAMSDAIFAAAFGIGKPASVDGVQFDAVNTVLTVRIDFKQGTRFAHAAHWS